MKMSRRDLVQKLSEISSGSKVKRQSKLIQKEVTMTRLKKKLVETMEDLNYRELQQFKQLLQDTVMKKGLLRISRQRMKMADRDEIVELMVKAYGQQSVEVTKKVLMMMNRTYLVQKLSEISSGSKEKPQSKLIQKEVTMTSLEGKLLETLEELDYWELKHFKQLLQDTEMKKGLPRISRQKMEMADRDEIVELMVKAYGQQSVEVTTEVLMMMNRRDQVQKLSEISSGSKEKPQSKLIQKEVTMTSLEGKLLETLGELDYVELKCFKQLLQDTEMKKGLPRISRQKMEMADRDEIVKLMVETYGQQSVEVTTEVLMMMNRRDQVQKLSEISSGSKVKPQSKLIQKQVSSDWTELEPEVNSTDADEAPTYSLQSEAGNFECSVSGLRWVCKEKVSFKYQFCSLKRHMERIESMQYMPAGPLMDITVIAGKLDEVHLPHWICIDDNPTILDKFAVLRIDDCGDVVEKVSEVTSSHVKLSEPAFSLIMTVIKMLVNVCFSVEINSKVLIYGTKTPFFTLRVYLIPPDPGLIQDLEKSESADGYRRFKKPHPKKPLKMNDEFILTAELGGENFFSDTLQLLHESTEPNFSEVFIEDPGTDLTLKLGKEKGSPPVWTCVIRQKEYQRTDGPIQVKEMGGLFSKPGPSDTEKLADMIQQIGDAAGPSAGAADLTTMAEGECTAEKLADMIQQIGDDKKLADMIQQLVDSDTAGPSAGAADLTTMAEGQHFVDRHRAELIDRVSEIPSILDQLLDKKIIRQESYDKILAIPTNQDRMRKLFSGPLNAAGRDGKEVFYRILQKEESSLIGDLKKSVW
ncbi:apoptosis-associated speck-like protein containing a CARD isoform X1 [Sebastes umbrosus]|uniref:apoptosis-associated speck-like protein containing a CARD isoform X1 n=1 Tax=Sebastes umbrosus TaxID=72105 RepID=UPI00189E2002|nr:apoptosis-associated speck-like protein containing a CARD isoform X1 [Sebastes umbrosus]